LKKVMNEGLERFGLAGLLRFDVEVSDDVAPDIMSGKLKRISSKVGPPQDAPKPNTEPVGAGAKQK